VRVCEDALSGRGRDVRVRACVRAGSALGGAWLLLQRPAQLTTPPRRPTHKWQVELRTREQPEPRTAVEIARALNDAAMESLLDYIVRDASPAAYWVAVPRGLHPLRPNRAVGVGRRCQPRPPMQHGRADDECACTQNRGDWTAEPGWARLLSSAVEAQPAAEDPAPSAVGAEAEAAAEAAAAAASEASHEFGPQSTLPVCAATHPAL
jgi:hypothetical protein